MLIYLLLINAAGLLFMLADKRRAIKGVWRIPENTLLGLAVAGGSVGCLLGMHLFHHKTKKPKFSIGIPVILAVQVVALVWFYS